MALTYENHVQITASDGTEGTVVGVYLFTGPRHGGDPKVRPEGNFVTI